MREILFRGKRLGDGEWVDGSLFIDEKKDKHEILVGYVNYRVGWEVDPKTVGQFTGLTDKNGKRIFEGDIVRHGERLYTVAYVTKYGRFAGTAPGCVMAIFPFGKCEVIGDIHDNSELIKEDS